MNNLRIYIVVPTFLPLVGGSEKQALAHGRSLRERGFVTTVITLRHEKDWLPREVIEGIPTIRVAGALLGGREKLPRPLQRVLYLMALLVMGWTLWRFRRRYDALHLYRLGLEALPVALVCQLTGKPLIVSVRGAGTGERIKLRSKARPVAQPSNVIIPEVQFKQQIQYVGDLAALERLGRPVMHLVRYLLHRMSAVVVILSSRMRTYLAAHDFNLPNTQLIPNGVDITRFRPIEVDTSSFSSFSQRDERAHTVVCVSRLRYEKGINVLLQAWYLVHKQIAQAKLIIVGDGPLQNQLEQMAEALDIADSVEFAGLQNNVAEQLHRGDLAVLPSLCEGMPNALLEAMACGLACVATRVSGSEDIIQHEVNGLLVEPEDYEGLADALITLMQKTALAQNYGHEARTTIEKHYSLEHTTDIYVELYQKMVNRSTQTIEATQTYETGHLSP